MTIKEKPLINAVSRLGALPGFLFANPMIAGFFAIVMTPVFGAVFTLFWGLLGTPEALKLFDIALFGAAGALVFSAIILIGITISAYRDLDEKEVRLKFVTGGVLAIVMLIILALFFLQDARTWFATQGPITCSTLQNC